MNTDKTRIEFMRDLTALNELLIAFQNQYPINYGAMFRHNFGLILVVLASWIFVLGYRGGYSFCDIPALLGVLGFFTWIKRSDLNTKNADPIDLKNKIAEVERNYSQYPDVQAFVKGFRAKVNAIFIKKKNMHIIFRLIMIVVGVLGASLALATFVYYKK